MDLPPRPAEEYDVESLTHDPATKEVQAIAKQLDDRIAAMAQKTRGAYTRIVGSLHLAYALSDSAKGSYGIIKLGILPEPPHVPDTEVKKVFYKLAIQSLQEDLRDLEAGQAQA